jgi:SAM-dependent methyltransferase
LTCQGCGRSGEQHFELAVERAGEVSPWLLFYRCPSCRSLTAEEAVRSAAAQSPVSEVSEELSWRVSVEMFCSLGRQIYGPRSFKDCRPKRMLDVGCGLGIGADFARRMLGAEAIGIDPSAESLRASQDLGYHLIPEFFDAANPCVEPPFDLIQAWELIEHVEHPRAMLSGFKSLLSPEGFLFLSTPAAEAVSREAETARVLGALAPPSHLHLFSEQALISLLKQAGFAHVEAERIGDQLVMTACARPPRRASKEESWAIYESYLEERTPTLRQESPFALGFQARRLQLFLSQGNWAKVNSVLAWFDQRLRDDWDLDLERESSAVAARLAATPSPEGLIGLPIALTLLLFAKGRLNQVSGNRAQALEWFGLARDCGKFTMACLAPLGLMDEILTNLTRRADAFVERLSQEGV